MAEPFSLKDDLFNPRTVGQLAAEYAAGVPGFDGPRFEAAALAGFPERELMARMEWMADCLEQQLAPDFPTMADQLEAAMPPPLDPALRDDDFGHFIHGLPGILAVRHGLEAHRDRALDLLYKATQRFSMEFYIRPFLNRWPEETLARLAVWVRDENYHVRRLVSEGTRPRLPWARNVTLTTEQRVPFLSALHADPTRYVTRSVANHLNDLSKTEPETVLGLLRDWDAKALQTKKERGWMARHALRTRLKAGHQGAMAYLGYRADVPVAAKLEVTNPSVKIGGTLDLTCTLNAATDLPVMVDYRIRFARPSGKQAERVFKMKTTALKADTPLVIKKSHRLKGNATTFTLYPGAHEVILQVNGKDYGSVRFDLTE